MWIVDTALKEREENARPIQVGIVGAGFMCQGLVNQITNITPGMRVAAVSNRRVRRAIDVFHDAGLEDVVVAGSQSQLDAAIARSRPAAVEDAMLLARSDLIDVLVDVTGSVEFGARIALEAFRQGKDVVLMNAELDATIGPILQTYADRHGVILTACEGDEPGIQMNLFRWVKGLGLTPRLLGNVKGLQDRYRNPTTQKTFAEKWGQNPTMVTSFADGSKVSFEQAVVANATGFQVLARGMSRGLDYHGDIMKIGEIYDLAQLRQLGGAVDYVVGISISMTARTADEAVALVNAIALEYFLDKRRARAQSAVASAHAELVRQLALHGEKHPKVRQGEDALEAARADLAAVASAVKGSDGPPLAREGITFAIANQIPTSPKGGVILGLSALAGLLLGIGLAAWRDRFGFDPQRFLVLARSHAREGGKQVRRRLEWRWLRFRDITLPDLRDGLVAFRERVATLVALGLARVGHRAPPADHVPSIPDRSL